MAEDDRSERPGDGNGWQGPEGISAEQAEALSEQFVARWELAEQSAFRPKSTLVGLNVPDEAVTTLAVSHSEQSRQSEPPPAASEPTDESVGLNKKKTLVGFSGQAKEKPAPKTMVGLPKPIEAEALRKHTLSGVPVPEEAKRTHKQTNVGIPVPSGAPDEGQEDAAATGPGDETTLSDVVLPSAPFAPVTDEQPVPPEDAAPPQEEPISQSSTAVVLPATDTMTSAPAPTEPSAPPDDDEEFRQMYATARRRKWIVPGVAAAAAVLIVTVVAGLSGEDESAADGDGASAVTQGTAAPALTPESSSRPKMPPRFGLAKSATQNLQAHGMGPTPTSADTEGANIAPPGAASPGTDEAGAGLTAPSPASKPTSDQQPSVPTTSTGAPAESPSGSRSSATAAQPRASAKARGALTRDPAGGVRAPQAPTKRPSAGVPASKPSTARSKPAPRPAKRKKSTGRIIRELPF